MNQDSLKIQKLEVQQASSWLLKKHQEIWSEDQKDLSDVQLTELEAPDTHHLTMIITLVLQHSKHLLEHLLCLKKTFHNNQIILKDKSFCCDYFMQFRLILSFLVSYSFKYLIILFGMNFTRTRYVIWTRRCINFYLIVLALALEK